MHHLRLLSRVGAVSGIARLIAFALEVLSFILLAVRHSPGYDWTTSYLIVSLVLHVYTYDQVLINIINLCEASVPHPHRPARDSLSVWPGPRMAALALASPDRW